MALFKSAIKELQIVGVDCRVKFSNGVYTTDNKEEIKMLKTHPMVWEVSTANEIKKSKSNQNIEL